MSKFLSMQWFKSKIEFAVEKVITNKIENLMEQEDDDLPGSDYDVDRKPYLNIKMVNDVLTIVMKDGSIISKPSATQEDFTRAKNAMTEEELYALVICNEVREERRKREAEIAKTQALLKGIESLKDLSDFTVKENTVYLKGIDRSLPQILVEEFLDVIETQKYYTGFGNLEADLADNEKYQSLKRFFMWCCLNPRAEVAHELYRFLKENSFRITKQGFFVALRNVVTLHGSPELVHFISNAYNKVKAVWKKSPDQYTVFLQYGDYKLVHNDDLYKMETVECDHCEGDEYWDEDENQYVTCNVCDGDGSYEASVPVEHGEMIGGLTELYLDLPNRAENRFTDHWTKKFDIRIGRVVNMPVEDCNWSTQDCAAAGLHFTSDQIHYVGCGDQSVLVLINPMKVVGIGQHKGRCYEYLPIMTVPREEATEILHDIDFDTLALDELYAVRELETLEEKAKAGFAAEAKKYDFNIPHVSTIEIKTIVRSLEEMKSQLSNRVVNLD